MNLPNSYAALGRELPPKRMTGAPPAVLRAGPTPGGQANQNLMGWVAPHAQVRWLGPGVSWYSPQRVEQIFRQGLAGDLQSQWEMFDLMEATWGELSTCLNQLKDAVVAQGLRVVPYARKNEAATPEAIERAALVQEALDGMIGRPEADENNLDQTVRDLLDARGKGISVLEIDWEMRTGESPKSKVQGPKSEPGSPKSKVQGPKSGEDAGEVDTTLQLSTPQLSTLWSPRCTRWVHPAWYGYPQGPGAGGLKLRTVKVASGRPPSAFPGDTGIGYGLAGGGQWQDFPADKFVIGLCKNKSGHPLGSALLHVLGFWWAASNFTSEWFLNFIQVFGQPFRWATYDPNMTSEDQAKLQSVLTNMGSCAWGMFPQGTTFELKDIAAKGSDNPNVALMTMANHICRMLILRQTLTGDAGTSGSRALGEVHERVLGGVEEACGKWVCNTLGQLVRSFCRLNFGSEQQCPTLVTGMDEEASLEELGALLVAVNQAGLEATDAAIPDISERLGFAVQRKAAPVMPGFPGQAPMADSQEPTTNIQHPTSNGEEEEKPEGRDPKAEETEEAEDKEKPGAVAGADASGLHQAAAEALGVPPGWLNPVREFLQELERKASDLSLADGDLLAFLDKAKTRVPELFNHMDVDELARTMEAGMGKAVMDGVRLRLRQRPEVQSPKSEVQSPGSEV